MKQTYDTYLCRNNSNLSWIEIINPDGSKTRYIIDRTKPFDNCFVGTKEVKYSEEDQLANFPLTGEYRLSKWAFRWLGLFASFLIGFFIYLCFQGVN